MAPKNPGTESEWLTRKKRIDPRLDAAGWTLSGGAHPLFGPFRTEEELTDHGPADYALWNDNQVVGVVEAKKLTVGPQNVLTQAERYAKGIRHPKLTFGPYGCPFLYATNGEILWFHDVRHPLNTSRRVAGFHTPNALKELLSRDFDEACETALKLPHNHPHHYPK